MPIKANREYRIAKPFEVRAADSDEKKYMVEGYATTFNEPYELYRDGDNVIYEQVDARAFDNCDTSDTLFMLNHEGMVYARNKNGTLDLSIDEHGLKVVADLGSTEESRKIHEAIAAGLIDQMSFAFSVEADAFDKKTRTRTITAIRKLYDVSCVSIPANPGTEISARSYFEGVIEAEKLEQQKAELETRKRKLKLTLEV